MAEENKRPFPKPFLFMVIIAISIGLLYAGVKIGENENFKQELGKWCENNFPECTAYCEARTMVACQAATEPYLSP